MSGQVRVRPSGGVPPQCLPMMSGYFSVRPSEGCRKWTLIGILLHADVQVRDTVADVAEALGISSFPALIVLPAHGGARHV